MYWVDSIATQEIFYDNWRQQIQQLLCNVAGSALFWVFGTVWITFRINETVHQLQFGDNNDNKTGDIN